MKYNQIIEPLRGDIEIQPSSSLYATKASPRIAMPPPTPYILSQLLSNIPKKPIALGTRRAHEARLSGVLASLGTTMAARSPRAQHHHLG